MRLGGLLSVWVMSCGGADKVAPCADGFVRHGAVCLPVSDPGDTGGSVDDPGGDTGQEDTGVPGSDWVSLPRDCTPPDAAPADPIEDLGELDTLPDLVGPESFLMELVEVVTSDDGDWVYGVGQGGLVAFDVSDPDAPVMAGRMPHSGHDRYHRVHLLSSEDPGAGLAYLTHRERGLYVVSVEDPEDMSIVRGEPEVGAGGMAQVGDLLYMTLHWGAVAVYDISARDAPIRVGTGEAGSSPWALVATDQALYLADGTAGLVVMDRTDATSPSPHTTLALGGVHDLALGDGVLYAAAGSAGVIALDITDPLAPVEVSRVVYGTNVQGIALDGSTLWVADQEGLAVLDVTDPLAPQPVASRTTPQWAMDIAAVDGRAWVADWGRLAGHRAQLSRAAPDLDLAVSEIYLDEAGDHVQLQLINRGQADLELVGASAGAGELEILLSGSAAGPGESVTVRLDWEGGPLDDTLCLASNDPDEPAATVAVHTGGGGVIGAVGDAAPDFVLEDLDGESHRLSEHLGHPVVLVYFATW